MGKQKIAEYYNYTIPFYQIFWHGETHAVHYGFWEESTKTVEEALLNENRFLAELARITPTDKVLDAGTGIGGSAIWLAKKRGCRVVGITLSEKQVARAREYAQKAGVAALTEFHIKDYAATGFPNGSFDVVWAIESVCHTEDKRAFFREAFRILKPKGRIVIADGFLLRDIKEVEKGAYRNFLDGLVLPDLWRVEDFKSIMENIGFREVKYFDKTEAVKPSSLILFRKCLTWYPVFAVARVLRLIPELLWNNGKAGLAQYKLVQSGLIGYGVFQGIK